MGRFRLLSQNKWLEMASQKFTAKTTVLVSENCNEGRIYLWMKSCRMDEWSLAQMTSPSCASQLEGFPPLGFAVRLLAMAGQDASTASLFTESEASWSISHSPRYPFFSRWKELRYEYFRSEFESL